MGLRAQAGQSAQVRVFLPGRLISTPRCGTLRHEGHSYLSVPCKDA